MKDVLQYLLYTRQVKYIQLIDTGIYDPLSSIHTHTHTLYKSRLTSKFRFVNSEYCSKIKIFQRVHLPMYLFRSNCTRK